MEEFRTSNLSSDENVRCIFGNGMISEDRDHYEKHYLLGSNAVESVENQPTFRRDLSPPSSGSKNKLSSKPELCFQPAFTLVSCSADSLTLKMKAICPSETSIDFQRNPRRYIPEDSTLYNDRGENLKSYIGIITRIFVRHVRCGFLKRVLGILEEAMFMIFANSLTFVRHSWVIGDGIAQSV
jgi:hypothetical protein